MRSQIGKFEIQRLLGKGSMGEVYLGLDPNLGREVAIKTITMNNVYGEEGAARFQREAKALAALNHPNIVTLFDFGIDDGISYLVMEYLEGEDLATLIQGPALDRAGLLEVLAQACDGLAFAHARGFVHRDLKPGNIRVVRLGDRIHAKLLDFGIASAACADPTLKGSWVGTVSYMAPEYLDSGKATPGSDLFAMGVIAYEILSGGRKPFAADTPTAVLSAILKGTPEPLDPGEVPAGLRDLAARALAKDPADRYPTATDLGAAIRAGLAAPAAIPSAPAVPAAPGAGAQRQLVVGRAGQANCLSLRVALRQAAPGATILVQPGQYRESLLVDKEVTLKGEGDAEGILILDGITVEAGESLTLADLTVSNGAGPALRLLPGARVQGRGACFQESPAGGVELGPGSAGDFLRCRFKGNGSAGLLALEGSQAALEDCELAGNEGSGLHAVGGARARLRSCRAVENRGLGVSAVDGAEVDLDLCEVAGNQGPGLLLDRGGLGRLAQCSVTGGRSLGLQCRPGASLRLEGCFVEGNALGGVLVAGEDLGRTLGPDNRIQDGILQF